jgi:hypothetical protein
MKKLAFALLTLTTFGTLTIPVLADSVIMQESENYIYQEGVGNSGQQTTRQMHRTYERKRGNVESSNYGAVQTTIQEGIQMGEDQDFRQTTIQQNEIIRNYRNRQK